MVVAYKRFVEGSGDIYNIYEVVGRVEKMECNRWYM